MSESVTPSPLGTTDILLSTARAGNTVEVTSPESATALTLQMIARQVEVDITGGPPGPVGPRGQDGTMIVVTEPAETYDPGDFTLIFENRLI